MTTSLIHPSAVIMPGAEIADGVSIGPFCVIGAKVKLARGVKLHSHVVIEGNTSIGEDTEVYPFTSLGHAPQDLKYKGEETQLVIGARNRIRENVTMNPGTADGGGITRIGDDCLFMASTHVAHDCIVGNKVIMANYSGLAGHVHVGDHAIIGGISGIMQFVRVGTHAMIGFMSAVEADVIPFGLVKGERASLHGLNLIGMQRRGFKADDIAVARKAFASLFHNQGTLADRMDSTANSFGDSPLVTEMLDFIKNRSKHGLCTPEQDAA